MVAALDELLLEDGEVLDDAVVHDDEVAGLRDVGVGVAHGRLTVGGPACVGDADGARAVLAFGGKLQVADLALGLVNIQGVVAVDERHTGRVVTTVFQTVKTFDEDAVSITVTDITYYSTHKRIVSCCFF